MRKKGSKNKVKHKKAWSEQQWSELKEKVAEQDAKEQPIEVAA